MEAMFIGEMSGEMAFLIGLSLHLYCASNKSKSHTETVSVIGLSIEDDLYFYTDL